MLLYTYFRSSASWRVRIALALKGISPKHRVIRTVDGEQNTAEFRRKNPLGVIPVLDIGEGGVLNQSLAIVEWLDETYPAPPLLPVDPLERARVRAFALAIACEIHPLNNLRVLNFLEQMMGQDERQQRVWYHTGSNKGSKHWNPQSKATIARRSASAMYRAWLTFSSCHKWRMHVAGGARSMHIQPYCAPRPPLWSCLRSAKRHRRSSPTPSRDFRS